MDLLKVDGTVVSKDVPQELVTELTDLNMAANNIADWLTEESICWMKFGEQADPITIRRDSLRQALTGATDYLLYKRYDHPQTTEGLHLYTNADLTLPHSEDIGIVRSSYVGNFMTSPDMKNDGSHVWHKVGIRLGNLYHNPLRQKAERVRSVKHDYIEYLIREYSMKVWIAPIREYAATFITQWLEPDLETAREFRASRLKASRIRRTEVRPAGRKIWKAMNAAQEVEADVTLPDEIYVESLDGEAIDLMELEGKTDFKLYRGGVAIQVMSFDPEDVSSVLTWNELLSESAFQVAQV